MAYIGSIVEYCYEGPSKKIESDISTMASSYSVSLFGFTAGHTLVITADYYPVKRGNLLLRVLVGLEKVL